MTKKALITGATSYLGRFFAESLQKAGYELLLHTYQSKKEAKEWKIGSVFTSDLSHKTGVHALAEEAADFATNDSLYVIHNAALFSDKADDTTWHRLHALNYTAPVMLTQALASKCNKTHHLYMLESGIKSVWKGYTAYLASKKALANMVPLLSYQLAPHHRINGIAPGVLKPEQAEKAYLDKVPMHRLPEPKEVVDTALWLDKNAYITGDTVVIDGGRHLV